MIKAVICSESMNLEALGEDVIFLSAKDVVNNIYLGMRYDIICLDVGMNRCVELAEHILKLDANVVIMFIMGYKRSEVNVEYYQYYRRNKKYEIPVDDILYFESSGRYIIIHLLDGSKQTFNDKLNHVEEQLVNLNLFNRVHQSYLVNKKYVGEMRSKNLILCDGRKIPVSRGRKEQARSAIFDT